MPQASLKKVLEETLGQMAVSTEASDLEAAAHDTWPLSTKEARLGCHTYKPDLRVRLSHMKDVPALLRIASQYKTPVTVRALGSSVTGQPLPTRGGIVLDLSQVPATFSVNETNFTVSATASYNGGALEDHLQKMGYTLGHSPQSLYRSTVGGWLATLATGQFSSCYGGIEDLVTGYTVVLADGSVIDLKASPRAAMGPDLRRLFIGSEGTLGVITEVCLKIFPLPESQWLETYRMPSVQAGLSALRTIMSSGLRPFLLRLYDTDEAKHAMQNSDFASPVLFVGSRGLQEMAAAEFSVVQKIIVEQGGEALGAVGVEGWMGRRFDFSSVEARLAREGGFAETIEVAHNWDAIWPLYLALKKALLPFADEVLAHFSHVYTQGTSMYMILLGQEKEDETAVRRLREIWAAAMEVCLTLGAELSHHHGGGLARSPYAPQSLGAAHVLLRHLKQSLDPEGILNPGKLGLS